VIGLLVGTVSVRWDAEGTTPPLAMWDVGTDIPTNIADLNLGKNFHLCGGCGLWDSYSYPPGEFGEAIIFARVYFGHFQAVFCVIFSLKTGFPKNCVALSTHTYTHAKIVKTVHIAAMIS
jgi:hypothetical protein